MTTSQPQTNRSSTDKPLESEEKKGKKNFLGLKTDPFIFLVSAGFVVIFVAVTLAFGSRARDVYASISGWLMENLGWMYIGGYSLMFIFLLGVLYPSTEICVLVTMMRSLRTPCRYGSPCCLRQVLARH